MMCIRFASLLLCLLVGFGCGALRAEQKPAEAPDEAPKQSKRTDGQMPNLPHLSVNIEEGYVDCDGKICLTEGPLELIATLVAAKEHEAIITLNARPKNIHLALLLLGLEPGSPGKWEYKDDKIIAHDPTGAPVRIMLLYEKDGERVERPINEFVRDSNTKKNLDSNRFVFAGSAIIEPEEREPFYAADVTGDIITLVSFPEEMIAMPTAASSSNENLLWEADTESLPEVGTPVKLRIHAAKKPDEKPKGRSE